MARYSSLTPPRSLPLLRNCPSSQEYYRVPVSVRELLFGGYYMVPCLSQARTGAHTSTMVATWKHAKVDPSVYNHAANYLAQYTFRAVCRSRQVHPFIMFFHIKRQDQLSERSVYCHSGTHLPLTPVKLIPINR
jgi:hypothetical protein